MKIKRMSRIAIAAFVAIVLIAGLGAFAYWSVQEQVTGNKVASGSMTMDLIKSDGPGTTRALDVSGLMPGGEGTALWRVTVGNAPTSGDDLLFSVGTVSDTVSLADNVQVAFLLCTGGSFNYWLTPSGAVALGSDNPDVTYKSHTSAMSAYDGMSWGALEGYTSLPTGAYRDVKVYYYLPLDCASDCHDDVASFDMTFELEQHH